MTGIEVTAVASRRADRLGIESEFTYFDDYAAAIARSGAELAYISTANSDHAHWARRCLEAGLHVVIDKPACLTPGEAQGLIDLAAAKRRCIAEATVFTYHPQVQLLQQQFDDAQIRPTRALAIFSFPPLDPRDFRYRRALGGGALYDLGPYVAATSRLLFGRAPRTVACEVLSRTGEGLETAFSVLLTYEGGGSFAGCFGFDTEYQNRLLVLGSGVSVDISRIFTLPADVPGRLVVRHHNVESELAVAPADAFRIFLQCVVCAIERGDWKTFGAALQADAQLVSELRRAAGER